MAAVKLHATALENVLVAATPKTVLQILAATNQRVVVTALRFLGKQAAGGTDAPVKVKLTRSTANFGTGTAQTAGSGTYAKNDPSDSETVQTAVATNFTAEPTSPADAGLYYEFQPQSGLIELFPPGCEIKIPGGQSLNIELTSAGTPTVTVVADFEE